MQLTFLGTSAGLSTSARNVSALTLSWDLVTPELWLFDCGEATQIQLRRAGLKPASLTKIFITHNHGDHLYGLMPLLNTLSMRHLAHKLTIFGPEGIAEFIRFNLAATHSELSFKLTVREFSEDKEIFHDKNFRVETFALYHRCPAYAFRVEYKGAKPQRIITIFGDTGPGPNEENAAHDADIVVHEATYAEDLKERAKRYCHSTGYDAAHLAETAGAKLLFLTHMSARYQFSGRQDLILEEAQREFPATYLAHDFSQYTVDWEKGGNHATWTQLKPGL